MRKTESTLKDNLIIIENLSLDEEYEESGICDSTITGIPIAQFSFADNFIPTNEPMLKSLQPEANAALSFSSSAATPGAKINNDTTKVLKDNRTPKSYPFGITPPIDGEYFDTRRTFIFRKSTIRALNELKSAHPDINIYLCSIVDKALRHYYDYIFTENGAQN